jgi:hypothetical protein
MEASGADIDDPSYRADPRPTAVRRRMRAINAAAIALFAATAGISEGRR